MWRCVDVEMWRCGCVDVEMEMWRCGDVDMWRCGCLEMWTWRCVDV